MTADASRQDPLRTLDQLPEGGWNDLDAVGDHIEAQLHDDARRCPAARTPVGVNVYERAAVDELLRDRRAACRMGLLAMAQGVFDGPLYDIYAADILDTNGPGHLRVRTIVSRALTPRRIAAHRPEIVVVVEDLVDAIEPGATVEVMRAVVDELPVRTICRLLGVPREDVTRLHDWLRLLPAMLSMDALAHQDALVAAYRGLHEFARVQLADRRQHPTDDLTTAIALAEEAGDRLTPDEAERFWVGLLNAGQETTRNVLGRGLVLFAEHPDQWDALRADPEARAATATEEILRLVPNTPIITPRLTEEDMELTLDGEPVEVPAGTVLYPVHRAANRDRPVYGDDADRFDVTREPPVPHLTSICPRVRGQSRPSSCNQGLDLSRPREPAAKWDRRPRSRSPAVHAAPSTRVRRPPSRLLPPRVRRWSRAGGSTVRSSPVDHIRRPLGPDDRSTASSEREREVLTLVGRGLSNSEIAADLYISAATVKAHVPDCCPSFTPATESSS